MELWSGTRSLGRSRRCWRRLWRQVLLVIEQGARQPMSSFDASLRPAASVIRLGGASKYSRKVRATQWHRRPRLRLRATCLSASTQVARLLCLQLSRSCGFLPWGQKRGRVSLPRAVRRAPLAQHARLGCRVLPSRAVPDLELLRFDRCGTCSLHVPLCLLPVPCHNCLLTAHPAVAERIPWAPANELVALCRVPMEMVL